MNIREVNKLMNEAINKYNLEGHQDVFGGMVWFALCLQDKEITCIDDHYKYETYNFVTPRFDNNADEIHEILTHHIEIIEENLQALNGI